MSGGICGGGDPGDCYYLKPTSETIEKSLINLIDNGKEPFINKIEKKIDNNGFFPLIERLFDIGRNYI